MNNIKTWLWLEEAPTTVSDIAYLLISKGVKTLRFSNPGDLVSFIIKEKPKGLENYGLLIDIMIQGAQFISAPNSWTGGESKINRTENGYDAGIVFIEQIVLNKDGGWNPFWNNPLPPIIFITTLTEDDEQLQRIIAIKQAWAKQMGCSIEDSKIAWWRKWELNTEKYVTLIKEW
jgi:hypothetical protein